MKTEAFFLLPAWLESRRLADAALGQAYDAAPATYRAAIKTGIALAHFHFGDAGFCERWEIRNEHLGFGKSVVASPKLWAVICIVSPPCAPALLASALALPLLAGVGNVLAIFAGCEPSKRDLLVMALCAIENVFCLDMPDLPVLLNELAQQGEGAIFAFGPEIADKARTYGIPCYEAQMRPKLLLAAPEHFDADLLRFLYGLDAEKNINAHEYWDCVFAEKPRQHPEITTRLLLGPGCEGFWLHGNIAPDFFKTRTMSFQAIA